MATAKRWKGSRLWTITPFSLVAERGLTREQAYCLCGVALDLKISQIVDAPNYIVSAYLPLGIFL